MADDSKQPVRDVPLENAIDVLDIRRDFEPEPAGWWHRIRRTTLFNMLMSEWHPFASESERSLDS